MAAASVPGAGGDGSREQLADRVAESGTHPRRIRRGRLVRPALPAGHGAQGAVKVVGTTPVGARERVVVVEVDGTWLLLGVGGGNVRLLHTWPKPDTTQEHER